MLVSGSAKWTLVVVVVVTMVMTCKFVAVATIQSMPRERGRESVKGLEL